MTPALQQVIDYKIVPMSDWFVRQTLSCGAFGWAAHLLILTTLVSDSWPGKEQQVHVDQNVNMLHDGDFQSASSDTSSKSMGRSGSKRQNELVWSIGIEKIGSSMKIMQGVAKKLKNWGEFVAKKLIKQDKQELKNCLCYNRGILRLWVRWRLKIRDLRNKVNSLSHVPDQTSTILSSRNLPRCDSGLPRNTQNCTGVMWNVLWTTTCSRRTIFYNLQLFNEFGIFISKYETWYFRDSKERFEKGIVGYADSSTSLLN